MRAYEAALNAAWAMSEEWIETVLMIAAREHDVSVDALEGYRAKAVKGADRLGVRNGVGILTARGPMFRYANLFTEISGATSYDTLRTDLQAALDSKDIRSIALNIDSPGGEVNGASELAQAIFDARKVKPVVAYVGGFGASAAYWLASAASEIVIADTAVLGSIGVKAAVRDTRKTEESRGVRQHEFISSQSPFKSRMADLDSEDGRARIQRLVDSQAQVFVEAVARYRGIAADDVIEKFGAGDVKVGSRAVAAGMADRLGSFEEVIADLSRGSRRSSSKRSRSMSEQTTGAPAADTAGSDYIDLEQHKAACAKAREAGKAEGLAEGAKAANDRMSAIVGDEKIKGRADTAMSLALKSPDMKAEDVVAFVAGLPIAAPTATAPTIAERMQGQGGALAMGPPMTNSPQAGIDDLWAAAAAKTNAAFGVTRN